jgi:peptidoglycan/LPS O-acetylase OafA/YrhL
MGLAVVSVAVARSPRKPRAIELLERWPSASWAIAAGLYLLACFGTTASGRWGITATEAGWIAIHFLYGASALFIVAPAVFSGSGRKPVHRILGNPVAAGLGLISYGIFLYNGPIASWVDGWKLFSSRPFGGVLLATLAITLPAAALSYWFIERPLLWFKDARLDLRRQRARSRLRETETPAA